MKKSNTKQLITVVAAALLCFSLNTEAQTTWGFTTGITLANAHVKTSMESKSAETKTGFITGLLLNIPAGKSFSIEPALHFVQKGWTDKGTITEKFTLNYLELPINAIYSTAGGFFIGAGPAFSFGISGKEKWDGTNAGSEAIKFGSGEDDVKSFELSGNILTGYRAKSGFMLAVNYSSGFTSILNGNSNDGSLKNNYWGIRLGWMLAKKK